MALPIDEYLIHHIFLPPRLPQSDDSTFHPNPLDILTKVTLEALDAFKPQVPHEQRSPIHAMSCMVANMRYVHTGNGIVNEEKLLGLLGKLVNEETLGTILLHIGAQNAGVIISIVGECVHFEAFELSPLNEAVYSTAGRLQRFFPGHAIAIDITAFQEDGFQATVAHTLAEMSRHAAVGMQPQARKSGQDVDEYRDTTDPAIITGLLMAFLQSVGKSASDSVISKNTREEVMWSDARSPWRRSPIWLLLRVTLQLNLSRWQAGDTNSPDLYKEFMVFLMSRVLKAARGKPAISSDLLCAMNSKISRRLLKLGSSIDPNVLHVIQNTLQDTMTGLNKDWSRLQAQNSHADLARLSSLDFARDTLVELPALNEYLTSIKTRQSNKNSVDFEPTCGLTILEPGTLPPLTETNNGEYANQNLYEFESWVALHLQRWTATNQSNPDTCAQLGSLIKRYHDLASTKYSGNPEAISIMHLTIMQLQMACDLSAVHLCPLLSNYKTGLSLEFTQNLLLPFKSQMQRLRDVEEYFAMREARAFHTSAKVLYETTSDCFAAKYFDQCPQHQALLTEIIAQAEQDKDAKLRELAGRKEEYHDLMTRHRQSYCQFVEVVVDYANDIREERHSQYCQKCGYSKKAEQLRIAIHEWPLPNNFAKQKVVVFELQAPLFFTCWRESVIFLLLEVLKADHASKSVPRAAYPLSQDSQLCRLYFAGNPSQRFGLLSQDKPHAVTHRKTHVVSSATEDDVCLPSGANYQYYDSGAGVFVSKALFLFTDKVPLACTYQLPQRSRAIQRFMFRTAATPNGPAPNLVISSQSDGPDHMSLQECKAVTSIPYGYRIQWLNILLQLGFPAINFKKAETTLVILQCIYQAGPGGHDVCRESHIVNGDNKFASTLVDNLRIALLRIKENWESSQSLSIFLSIASRLLSLNASTDIQDSCMAFLKDARETALGWIHDLREKALLIGSHSGRTEYLSKRAEIALVCVDSFSVDDSHLTKILTSSIDQSSILIQCTIIVQESKTFISGSSEPTIQLLHLRFQRLLHRCYRILASNNAALDDAVGKVWTGFNPGAAWTTTASGHWLTTTTKVGLAGSVLRVHVNMLNGELLVNGLPLDRLPARYEKHASYRTLFGHSAIEVMPTAVPGMEFAAKQKFAGYSVQFGMNEREGIGMSDLLIQASKDGQRYELIPADLLHRNFPAAFTDDYLHWYNVASGVLEFRPIGDQWNASCSRSWTLAKDQHSCKWQLTRDASSLVLLSLTSATSKALSRVLSPLADPTRIHIILQPSLGEVEIEIPGLQLGFILKPETSDLQCREFPRFFVDADQSLGTLVGLQNKLLLKPRRGNRLVLLLDGQVSYGPNEDRSHVRVTVQKPASTFHAFDVDGRLGRLIDNGSLQSKLFLVYLHALTSFRLPDPLTHRTGTEQALSILSSAAVRSFDLLTGDNIILLTKIATLTPSRKHYPANERVMQTVKWSSNLGFLAQHPGFDTAVGSIFEQARRSSMFYPESQVILPNLARSDTTLVQRDSVRTAMFRVSEFGAEEFTTAHDAAYQARDRDQSSLGFSLAFKMSSFVYQQKVDLDRGVPSDMASHLWNVLASTEKILGHSNLDHCKVEYDATLLADSLESRVFPFWIRLNQGLGRTNKFSLMIWLSTLACSTKSPIDTTLLQTMALFFTRNDVARVALPPLRKSYRLRLGKVVRQEELRTIVTGLLVGLRSSPDFSMVLRQNETTNALGIRRKLAYNSMTGRIADLIVERLAVQWPCENPVTPDLRSIVNASAYIDIDKVMEQVRPKFLAWFNNLHFFYYLQRIGRIVAHLQVSPIFFPERHRNPTSPRLQSAVGFISVQDLFGADGPRIPECRTDSILGNPICNTCTSQSSSNAWLTALIDNLQASAAESEYKKSYVADLKDSILELQKERSSSSLSSDFVQQNLGLHLQFCKSRAESIYNVLLCAVSPRSIENPRLSHAAAAFETMQWPRVSPAFFLQQLSRLRWPSLNQRWKDAIVEYGLALTALQRAERLIRVFHSGSRVDLINELLNSGHVNWQPHTYPDSLLLEVEGGILIREVQESIARHMRDPQPARNIVLQLNMGEGKSSLILPIVAAHLANGCQLVRIVVAKPQSRQMAQTMISRLGGLLDRRVYYMPFSRALKPSKAAADAIAGLLRECMSNGGILLIQPEHILSFQLMCVESFLLSNDALGHSLVSTQDFFDKKARDLVDESDENYSTKFELIYTIGTQKSVEMSPERWLCIQEVLGLLRTFGQATAQEFPGSIELTHCLPGRFPRMRILKGDAQKHLFDTVARKICDIGLCGFPIARQASTVREAVFKYITKLDLTPSEIEQVENSGPGGFWAESTKSTLLLLRGLFASEVLAFAFGQKRWKVNYGLDATRNPSTKLAVPYRAKDTPSPRSEFSHPDVIIVLTALSHYYGGLGEDDLSTAFDHLAKSDQANTVYQSWVKDADEMPTSLSQLESTNLRDKHQFTSELLPRLRYGKATIDYFLANVVFPKQMKEFPHKLSVSGWDIGKIKTLPTTGFSGTNDSRTVLPLHVEQMDISEQKHTNALVLEYLLESGNAVAAIPAPTIAESSVSDAERLLQIVIKLDPPVQVILDVGAQILELDNLGVAKRWLAISKQIVQAVVFFDEHDELSVVNRKGRVESLQISSFATRLDVCLVFLDESHTRGTDLRLPEHYRAAVTLGAGLDKDRLVQACMRMRKLGKGQTVIFCVTEEIRAKVLERSTKSSDASIDILDILQWAISETWIGMWRSMPLWYAQGERFIRQNALWEQAQDDGRTSLSQGHAMRFLEDEAQSLEDRYRPSTRQGVELISSDSGELARIKQRCLDFSKNLSFNSATLREEQERELAPEIEQERQIQKPAPAKPHAHSVHPDLFKFVATGVLPVRSQACQLAFNALFDTSAAQFIELSQLSDGSEHNLLVTKDFARTIDSIASGPSTQTDSFQRPVQWIMTAISHGVVTETIVVSPFEAQELIPLIKKSSKVALHLYTPRCNAGFSSIDRLGFFIVPHQPVPTVDRRIIVQLNLFSGQLYINNYSDFKDMCGYLGLATETAKDGWEIAADGFILKDEHGRKGAGSALTKSPVKFFQMLMTIRRDGESFSKTHMGALLEGRLLQASDFES